MQRVARLAIMEVRTTEPYSPWKNKAESVIKTIKGESKRRRDQRNTHHRIRDSGMVWEAEIYYCTAGKYGHPSLERVTGDTIDISE